MQLSTMHVTIIVIFVIIISSSINIIAIIINTIIISLACVCVLLFDDYRKLSNIRRTQSPNLNVSRLVLQLSLPNPMKPGVKSRMKM